MQAITSEIERALAQGLYYLAISLALSLPDICAALESADGLSSGSRYKAWYEKWMAEFATALTPDDCYSLRCGVLHQGRLGHPKMQYSRVILVSLIPESISGGPASF